MVKQHCDARCEGGHTITCPYKVDENNGQGCLVPTMWRNFLIYQLLYHEKDNNVFNGGDADDSMQPITRPGAEAE